MFGKSTPQPPPVSRQERKEQSFLQSGVKLQGEIEVAGDLRIEGSVKGGLNIQGVLLIGSQALVEADIKGREVVIHGTVGGTVRADERIHLAKGAKVKGDLYCNSLIIDEGVHFEGRSHMDSKPEKGERSAPGRDLQRGATPGQKQSGQAASAAAATSTKNVNRTHEQAGRR